MPTAGELYRLARLLRDAALSATATSGDDVVPLSLVVITDDIAAHDRTTISEIAARTGLAQSLVSRTVEQLRAGSIVRTRRDDADRRRTLITVTARARKDVFAARGRRGITDALRERRPDLDAAQLRAVEAQLDALIAALTP